MEKNESSEQKERGERIKKIRENELKVSKTELGKRIGVSGQFLGLVEDGRANLSYKSIKKLRDITSHSADYILYGLDDNVINDTRECMLKYSEEEIMHALNIIKELSSFIKKK